MRLAYVAAFVASLLLARVTPASVVTGPVVNPANGHSYYLLSTSTWTDSQAEAVTLGGDLATIENAAENAWVCNTFSNYAGIPRDLWIGLNDAANEGDFTWVSGSPSTFRFWASGEPNNGASVPVPQEDYVHIWAPASNVTVSAWYQWNDHPGSGALTDLPFSVFSGVVEVVPEPAASTVLAGMCVLFCRRREYSVSACADNAGHKGGANE